jgi:hypothetical protein
MTDEIQAAVAKIPTLLGKAQACEAFGEGEREGANWLQGTNALADRAEDSLAEIHASFEVPMTENEADFALLDQLAEGWNSQPPSEEELASIALGWGAYFGEVIRQTLGGRWILRSDEEHASLSFERLGLEFFPIHAVIRRFMLGLDASLEAEYERLVETLTRS